MSKKASSFCHFKDMHACSAAIEAPFQFCLTYMLVSLGILELYIPTYEVTYATLHLTWWPFVAAGLSIAGNLFGSSWIYELVTQKTNKIVGFLWFVPLFFYRDQHNKSFLSQLMLLTKLCQDFYALSCSGLQFWQINSNAISSKENLYKV